MYIIIVHHLILSFVPLMIAIGCRRVKYCGRKCQKLDWKAHKAVCQAQSFLGHEGDKEELMDVKHMMTWYVMCLYICTRLKLQLLYINTNCLTILTYVI